MERGGGKKIDAKRTREGKSEKRFAKANGGGVSKKKRMYPKKRGDKTF